MDEIDGVEVVAFADDEAFDGWLAAHHGRHAGVWVKVAKKGSGIASVTSDGMVDVGLCWGWISGQRRSLDGTYYLQKYVPRRPKSLWSQVNVDKVAVLAAEGRMREPGLEEVRKAQADGRWDAAYAPQSTAGMPDELTAALAANDRAAKAFEALEKTAKYLVLLPLLQARTPEGRRSAVERAVRALAADE
ncbi:YdeI family protein [Streptomyces sp. NPDC059247]|uniref:YdeI/OmpD-associated family protein n=1 Tax=Streptomyces sp. NPDC059247 TaxID=3346790 RepID=UPI00369F17AC